MFPTARKTVVEYTVPYYWVIGIFLVQSDSIKGYADLPEAAQKQLSSYK